MNLQILFGITAQYLGTIENGENCLSVEKLVDLSNKTNLSLDYIVLGKTNTIDENIIKKLPSIKSSEISSALSIIKQVITILENK